MKRFNIAILTFLLHVSLLAQVTIGNSEKPVDGALLQLSNLTGYGVGEANSTKGLGLPRVALKNLNSFQMGDRLILDTDGDGNQYEKHIGLIIYNTTKVENSKELRICLGAHVWDGSLWIPLIPYPNHKSTTEIINEKYPPKLITDNRDGEQYWTGWFGRLKFKGGYDLTEYTPYSCDPNQEVPSLEDGLYWFTQNLRTIIGMSAASDNPATNTGKKYAFPSNTARNNSSNYLQYKEMGLLYSSEVAYGSNYTNLMNNVNQSFQQQGYLIDNNGHNVRVTAGALNPASIPIQNYELEATDTKIQGPCPDGWRMPSQREWYQLLYDITQSGQSYSDYYKDEGLLPSQKKNTGWFMAAPHKLPGDATDYINQKSDESPKQRIDVYQSNLPSNNGFYALLTGFFYASSPTTGLYGNLAWFTSVSSVNQNPATNGNLKGKRAFGLGKGAVTDSDSAVTDWTDHNNSFTSIRCVKY